MRKLFHKWLNLSRFTLCWLLLLTLILELYQKDAKIVFLNGELDTEIHIDQLEVYVVKG